MKEKLKKLYNSGVITMNGLLKAIGKGLITVDDAVVIVGKDKAMEIVRDAKLNEISEACNKVIVNGIDLEFHDTSVHFNLSLEDQANISNLFKVVELGGTEYPYQSDGGDGGVCRVYSAVEIVKIYFAAQILITAQTTYHNALKSYIQTLNDVETISTISYGMELPNEYQNAINEKMTIAKQQMQAIIDKIEATQ